MAYQPCGIFVYILIYLLLNNCNRMIKEVIRKWLPVKTFFALMHAKNLFFPTREYLITKEYYKRLKFFYGNFIQHGDLVFDVGANFGSRVKTFLSLGAKVVAVEPQPKCVRFLRNLFGTKITLIDKGLAAKTSAMDFFISSDAAVSSFSKDWVENVAKKRFSGSKYEAGIKIPVTTLDVLIDEFGIPAFIKIDVEGFEFEVIKGLNRKVKCLSFEYIIEKRENVVSCILHLQKFGELCVNYSQDESMQLGLETWLPPDAFIGYFQTNAFDDKLTGDIYVRYLNNGQVL
jgi:FkbM family methyltransferase